MRIQGVRLRVSLKRVNVRSVLASSIHKVRYGSSNNDNICHVKSPLSNRYFKGVYDALNNGGIMYQSSLPFHIRWDRIQRHLAVLGRVSTGNTVIPYRDSGEAFRVMWKAVDKSKKSVLWQTYICKDDHVGKVTVSKMEAAHKRGCHTELLYDCGGNITGRRRLVENLKQSGATVIMHRPILDHFLPYFLGGMKWERSPGIRNHRKILLVDNSIGFCGGLNIGNEYCGKSEGGTGRFRDTQCSVVGPAVAHLREVYDDTKAPKPWKWSFARWRQIAATAMDRRYKQGKNVKDDYIVPMQRSVQQRGKVYLRRQMEKAEENRVFIMERMRWKRQREKLERLVSPWYRKSSTEDVNKKEFGRHTSVETTSKEKEGENNNGGMVSHAHLKIIDRLPTRLRSCMQHQRLEYHQMHHLSPLEEKVMRELGVKGQVIFTLQDEDPVPEAEEYSKTRPAFTQVLSCNPHTRDWSIPYAFWQVSQKAHRRLWVTTPYYMPHRKLMRALLRAACRGVDVRILAGSNTTTDPWFMWYASNYITGRFLAAGVRVYEYKGDQVMHAKTVVVDSIWSSVGSYNWDMMSNKNMEVCVCHLDYKLAREMERHFLDDLKVSVEVKYEDYRRRSLWVRFLSWFFYIGLQIAEKLAFRTFVDADLSSKLD